MKKKLLLFSALLFNGFCVCAQSNLLVFQTDFGLKDGAVAAMKGVAMGVSQQLKLFDLTHEIPAYNIWEAAYRLQQTASYWPAGTVFVSVVDPGVGSERKSIVLKTKTGHYFVGPDNGSFTLVAESMGIDSVCAIDETKNRLQRSGASYTFHGRDVYAYTGARLAAGVIQFHEAGPVQPPHVVMITYQHAVFNGGSINGNIPVLDIQYGNVWTNIDKVTFASLDINYGDTLQVQVWHDNEEVYAGKMPYVTTFSAVQQGKPLAYLNSLLCLSFALNEDSFAAKYSIASGAEWSVRVSKAAK